MSTFPSNNAYFTLNSSGTHEYRLYSESVLCVFSGLTNPVLMMTVTNPDYVHMSVKTRVNSKTPVTVISESHTFLSFISKVLTISRL